MLLSAFTFFCFLSSGFAWQTQYIFTDSVTTFDENWEANSGYLGTHYTGTIGSTRAAKMMRGDPGFSWISSQVLVSTSNVLTGKWRVGRPGLYAIWRSVKVTAKCDNEFHSFRYSENSPFFWTYKCATRAILDDAEMEVAVNMMPLRDAAFVCNNYRRDLWGASPETIAIKTIEREGGCSNVNVKKEIAKKHDELRRRLILNNKKQRDKLFDKDKLYQEILN